MTGFPSGSTITRTFKMKTYDFARIQARPFPTAAELKNPYIYGRVRYVLNVSETEYPEEIEKGMKELGIQAFHFPLVESGADMGLENILKAVRILEQADAGDVPVIVHCGFGNNRSRVVVEFTMRHCICRRVI